MAGTGQEIARHVAAVLRHVGRVGARSTGLRDELVDDAFAFLMGEEVVMAMKRIVTPVSRNSSWIGFSHQPAG
jgi:hypothetical protein